MKHYFVALLFSGTKPDWFTSEHVIRCTENALLQFAWTPSVGDWFVCSIDGTVHTISDLAAYHEGQHTMAAEYENGRWSCDIYIPEPKGIARAAVRLRTHQHPPKTRKQ